MAHDFSQPEYLYRLARSGSTLDRKDLAQAVTSLLHSDLTSSERDLAQDILLQLLSEAELDLRKNLAQQLATEPNCPQPLLDFLVFENPFIVSESVIRLSEKLTDEYLIEVAKRFDNSDYWMAMAQRKNVGEDLCRFLVGTDSHDVFVTLVENKGAHFCTSSITWLVNVAPHIPDLQKPLIARPEVTPDLAVQLYCHVAEDLRKQIESRFTLDKGMLDQAMERAVRNAMPIQKKDVPKITPDALMKADRMKEENSITSRQIVETLKRGEVALFACMWGALLAIDPGLVLKKLEDEFVSTLSVLVHSARITRSDYNAMFQAWRKLQPFQDSKLDNMPLSDVMGQFDKMTLEKARKAIARWTSQQTSSVH